MSALQSRTLLVQEGIPEIELSAEDVKDLLRPRPTLVKQSASPKVEVQTRVAGSRASAWQIGAVVCAAAVAAIIGVAYLYKFAGTRTPPPTVALPELEAVIPSVVKKALPPPGPPVLMKNPFDKREVFEFPAGTSQHDAREAVAKILMDRAIERRVFYTSNQTRRRKSG